jgi:single-strand DNA-binding protein
MILSGAVRLGRDVDLRYLADGTAVANLAVVFNYGRKVDAGNRPSQWLDVAFFGKRAESLSPYLLKGGLLNIVINEVHIETYEGKNGPCSKLVGRVLDIELTGSGVQQQNKPAPQQAAPQAQKSRDNFDGFDDDIPF